MLYRRLLILITTYKVLRGSNKCKMASKHSWSSCLLGTWKDKKSKWFVFIFRPKMFQGHFWRHYHFSDPTDLAYSHLASMITMSNINKTMLWFVMCFALNWQYHNCCYHQKYWCYIAQPCIICLDKFEQGPKSFPAFILILRYIWRWIPLPESSTQLGSL